MLIYLQNLKQWIQFNRNVLHNSTDILNWSTSIWYLSKTLLNKIFTRVYQIPQSKFDSLPGFDNFLPSWKNVVLRHMFANKCTIELKIMKLNLYYSFKCIIICIVFNIEYSLIEQFYKIILGGDYELFTGI